MAIGLFDYFSNVRLRLKNKTIDYNENTILNLPGGGGSYTDEEAQDAVGTILTDSSEIDFTYNDATPSITASIVAASIDESKLDASVNASLDLADSAVQPASLSTYFNKSSDDTDDITVGATNKFATAAEKTKLGYISVTQAVDLDTMESDIAGKQASDSDLTAIAGLTPSNDDFLQRKAGAWANRTVAQVKSDLGLTGTNSGDQTSIVGISGTTAQFNTALSDGDFTTLSGTETLTNKRITKRVGTEASSATSTPTADTVDMWTVTALAASDTFAAPTGTPTNGQTLLIRIKDNGTARAQIGRAHV